MICPNCGTQNIEGSKFCIKCGNDLTVNNENQVQPQQLMNQNVDMQQQMQNQQQFNDFQQQDNSNPKTNTEIKAQMSNSEYFFLVSAVILKPFTAFKEELNKFNEFKNSAIVALIVSVIATLITLVKTMFNMVRVKSYWSKEVEWVWENLKEINYVQVIGKNFLIYVGMILAIACVYYIGSLIIKKQSNFSRLLGISATSIVPMLLCSMILSPLAAIIYAPLGIAVTVIGGVYSIIIIYETINKEILLEGNAKYYFNLVCLSILILVGYYLYMKFFIGASASIDINNIWDYLK